MKALKFDTKTLRTAGAVIGERDKKAVTDRYEAKKEAERLGDEVYSLLLKCNIALEKENAHKAQELYEDIVKMGECITMKDLRINGEMLKQIGITDGKTIGIALKAALDEAHKDNKNNNEEYLADFVRSRFIL